MDQQTKSSEYEVTHFGGINQADSLLDVQKHEFATLQSLYPYEVGNLKRIPGKLFQLLYGGQVRGIFQMHTPFGNTLRFTQTTIGLYHDADSPSPWTPLAFQYLEMNDYILIQDEKAQGTEGGTFAVAGWRTRDINTEKHDTGNNCTIAANQFTLQPGTYRIHARVPQYSAGLAHARLQNITDGTTVLYSGNVYSNDAAVDGYNCVILGMFIIAAAKAFEIQHYCGVGKATNGFGRACNLVAGKVEIYTQVELVRVA